MKNIKYLVLLLAVSCQLIASPAMADPAMDSVIGKVLAAYGGNKLQSVNTYRMTGTVDAKMRKTEGAVERLFSRPDRLYVDLAYAVNPERRFLDRERGWRTDPGGGGINEVDGALLKSMTLQAARANIPWILDENREDVTQAAAAKVGETMTMGLQIILEPGLILRLYVDPKTSLILYSQAILNTETMKTHFETAYSDFKEVDGVLFPHHEENWASGFHTGTTVIETIEINPKVKDGDFRPE